MATWLTFMVVGAIIWGVALAPVCPAEWKPFAKWTGGVIFFVGFLLLIVALLHLPIPA